METFQPSELQVCEPHQASSIPVGFTKCHQRAYTTSTSQQIARPVQMDEGTWREIRNMGNVLGAGNASHSRSLPASDDARLLGAFSRRTSHNRAAG